MGNSGTSATLQFNTESDEVPDPVHNGAGSQHTAQRLAYTAGSPTGSFVFWAYQPGASQNLYGQLYDNAFTGLWNAGSPQALFNAATNYTFQSAVEDGTGGVIVMALQASDTGLRQALRRSGRLFLGVRRGRRGVPGPRRGDLERVRRAGYDRDGPAGHLGDRGDGLPGPYQSLLRRRRRPQRASLTGTSSWTR